MKKEFYPTPKELLGKIFKDVTWWKVKYVLEPSAGMGDIADYIKEAANSQDYSLDIDCVEIEPEFREILKGKGYPVVHDNFLTFHTYKQYDLIVMNPPFSEGDKHLMKALNLMRHGGDIICILNAETVRNPYTNIRKDLTKKLEEYRVSVDFMLQEFSNAVRKTDVEIAVVRIHIPEATKSSLILDGLRKKEFQEQATKRKDELVLDDVVEAAIQQYELEVQTGIQLIQEYEAMKPYLLEKVGDSAYNYPIIEMKIGSKDPNINQFVKMVRKKYWSALFDNRRFTSAMTSNLLEEYRAKVEELSAYDFSYYNIKTLQESMSKELVRGVEDCIVAIFDKLSYQYSYSDELSNNIHYYNGWRTNKSWIINKKVIIPGMNAWNEIFHTFDPTKHRILTDLMDIEKALDYLNSGSTDISSKFSYNALDMARKEGVTKKIHLKYFDVTFYKKGTCHLEFTDFELLKKLNIFGSQQKRWLPPSYGEKHYQEMEPEEKSVIDSFEGKEEYEKTLKNANFYIYNPCNSILSLELVG